MANDIKFRCSSLGYIMPGPREKKGEIAQTVINHLVDVFVSYKYGRREDVNSKYLDKGNAREEDSITLISRLKKQFYKKNDQRLTNDYISGECDIFIGDSVETARETIDTKTSWSAYTFFRSANSELDKKYYWQGVGYMWLTGAKKHTVSFCLVNGTAESIMDEKRRASYEFGPDPSNNPDFKERCRQIEINHIFDLFSFKEENPWFEFDNDLSEWVYDIPMNDRLYTVTIERNEEEIEAVKARVIECRNWMIKNLLNTGSV